MAALSNPSGTDHQVFLQSDLPPTFERAQNSFMDFYTDSIPERASSFGDDDFRISSRASQGLRLVFQTHGDLETFLHRCDALRLPKPLTRDIRIANRDIYGEAKLAALQEFLGMLDFCLAFEVEKAVWGGLLEPEEVLSMQDSLVELQQGTQEIETAEIFRYFLTNLSVPGLESAPSPSKKGRGRTKKQRVASSPVVDLRGKLVEAIEAYIAELYRPKGRYTPSAAICQSYHLVLTPSTQILDGPLPDQSNSVLR